MSVRVNTHYICDVCQKIHYSESSITKVKFSYDTYEGAFDCCYECLRGNERMRTTYRKIIEFIFRIKDKQESEK